MTLQLQNIINWVLLSQMFRVCIYLSQSIALAKNCLKNFYAAIAAAAAVVIADPYLLLQTKRLLNSVSFSDIIVCGLT